MERHGDPADESVIDRLFLHDVAALNFLFGEFCEISAHASQGAMTSTLGIQLSGNGILARWSTTLVDADEIAKLSINASTGTAQLVLFPQGFELYVNGEVLSSSESVRRVESKSVNTHATELAFLNKLTKDREKKSSVRQNPAGREQTGQWRAAIMAAEALQGLKRSLDRGRTINIRVEEATEETNFKGTMTALGCGMLLFSVFSLAVVALSIHFVEVAGFPRLAGVLQKWPYLLLLSFILFLVAQLLMLLSPKRTSSGKGTNSETK